MNQALLLTASINVNNMQDAYFDADVRVVQYIDAIRYYRLNLPNYQIIFVEHSGYDLNKFKEKINKEGITYISTNSNDFPREWGKGYGEITMLEKAVSECNNIDFFIKINGRLKILNIKNFINKIPADTQLLCDIRGFRLMRFKNNQPVHSDTRVFCFSRTFFMQKIYNKSALVRESKGYYLENLIHDIAITEKSQKGVYDRFRTELYLQGFGAHSGGKKYDSPKQKLKSYARHFFRIIFPRLKI